MGFWRFAIVGASCAAIGCGDATAEVAATRGAGGADPQATTTTVGGSGGLAEAHVATCGKKIYQCGDLQDNDGDGLMDEADPDCLGPCDNTEDSYFGGIPGQNQSPCRMDCYFDDDSGHGDDECFWSHRCDPHEVEPFFYPEPNKGDLCAYDARSTVPGTELTCEELEESQSEVCLETCGPLTPNGCDCFGCCELPAGSNQYVWLGSVGADGTTLCTAEAIDDPTVCHPCTPVGACFNGCDPCEYCLGKTELPPHCNDPGEQCEGFVPCGPPGADECPSGTYCITGCCVPVPE